MSSVVLLPLLISPVLLELLVEQSELNKLERRENWQGDRTLTLLFTIFEFRCGDSCGTGAEMAERKGAPVVLLLFLFEAAEAKTAAAYTRPEEVRVTLALAASASLAQSLSALATALATFASVEEIKQDCLSCFLDTISALYAAVTSFFSSAALSFISYRALRSACR